MTPERARKFERLASLKERLPPAACSEKRMSRWRRRAKELHLAPARNADYLKVVVSFGAVKATGTETAFLERAAQNRTGNSRYDRAFQLALFGRELLGDPA